MVENSPIMNRFFNKNIIQKIFINDLGFVSLGVLLWLFPLFYFILSIILKEKTKPMKSSVVCLKSHSQLRNTLFFSPDFLTLTSVFCLLYYVVSIESEYEILCTHHCRSKCWVHQHHVFLLGVWGRREVGRRGN